MVWVAFALMTGAAVLCLIWPLAGQHKSLAGKAADIEFYASQLAEVEAETSSGLVSPSEAESARGEIGRRLLAAAAQPDPGMSAPGFRLRRIATVLAAAAVVPLLALGLYVPIGHPDQPDQPIASREASPGFDLASALPRIEAHLAADPNDGRGFELIAPIYLRLGRYDDAVRAYAATLRIQGESAERRAAHGQALVMAADGVVTAEARADFDKALSENPKLPDARFFQAVAAEQDGNKDRARELWAELAADAPAGAPWMVAVRQHVAALSGQPAPPGVAPAGSASAAPSTGPGGPAAAGIAALPPEQRLTAIKGMVDGLAARLAQNGRDPEGWLRLVKAYTVLGDPAKARVALTDAHKALDGDAPALSRLDDLARQLGLEG